MFAGSGWRILLAGGPVRLQLHPLAALIATSVVAASVLPVLAQAQTDMGTPPAAHGPVAIPQDVLRSRARSSLDRASAFVAMAREAPAAATDPASAHRASELAHESGAVLRLASAEFAKGGYQKAIGGARRSIGVAQAAISAASVTPAQAVVVATVVENVSGGNVALDAPADPTPDGTPAPVVRSRYHGAGPDAPPRPANWRVLGAVPFGSDPVQGVKPECRVVRNNDAIRRRAAGAAAAISAGGLIARRRTRGRSPRSRQVGAAHA